MDLSTGQSSWLAIGKPWGTFFLALANFSHPFYISYYELLGLACLLVLSSFKLPLPSPTFGFLAS